jgi:hypothetical protein
LFNPVSLGTGGDGRATRWQIRIPDTVRYHVIPVMLAFVIGCGDRSQPARPSLPASSEATSNDVDIEELGDRIAGLTQIEASELSDYLQEIHGIAPAGQRRSDSATRRDKSTFSDGTVLLGDTIASLTLSQSTALSDYIASKHGIEPASSGELLTPSQ